jgi:hypothetical protein
MHDTLNSTWVWVSAGLVLGLLSSPHCFMMCGPISLFLGSRTFRQEASRVDKYLFYLYSGLGKAFTYSLIGLTFGYAGKLLTRWSAWMQPSHKIPYVISFLFLLLAGNVLGWWRPLEIHFGKWTHKLTSLLGKLPAPKDKASFFVTGLLWGMIPCPMVLAPALGAAVAGNTGGVHGALQGFAMMFSFGLGTIPVIVGAALFGAAAKQKTLKMPTYVSGGLYLVLSITSFCIGVFH